MPLIRRGSSSPPPPETAASTGQLSSPNVSERWAAARALGEDQNAVPQLAAALVHESAPEVRDALFTSLMVIHSPAAAEALAALIRSDDAQLRTGALDTLGAMPDVSQPLLPGLLADHDSDVRLLACELVRAFDQEEGTRILCDALRTEQEANVCGAAVDVLAEIGTSAAVSTLKSCAERFASESYLKFAIANAIDRVSGRPARHE